MCSTGVHMVQNWPLAGPVARTDFQRCMPAPDGMSVCVREGGGRVIASAISCRTGFHCCRRRGPWLPLDEDVCLPLLNHAGARQDTYTWVHPHAGFRQTVPMRVR